MGDFRIEINAVGGHGCDRDAKDGDAVKPCNGPGCPDCMTRDFVAALKRTCSVNSAVFTHWPGAQDQISDVYEKAGGTPRGIEVRRRGSF